MCLPDWVARALTISRQVAPQATETPRVAAFIHPLPKETISR